MNRRELLKFGAMAIVTSPALPLEGFAVLPAPALEAFALDPWQERYLAARLAQRAEIFRLLGVSNRLLGDLTWRDLETSRSNVVASRGGKGSQGSEETIPERTR